MFMCSMCKKPEAHCVCYNKTIPSPVVDPNVPASKSKECLPYTDLNTSFLQRTSRAMEEGRRKYEDHLRPWQKNYHKGNTDFAIQRLNHAIEHLFKLRDFYYKSYCDSQHLVYFVKEDDLGHAAANLNMLCFYEEEGILPSCEKRLESEIDNDPSRSQ